MNDIVSRSRMPPEVLNLVNRTLSFNLSGVTDTGEGEDFRLEEINKVIQQWISAVPTARNWKSACSNQIKCYERKFRYKWV